MFVVLRLQVLHFSFLTFQFTVVFCQLLSQPEREKIMRGNDRGIDDVTTLSSGAPGCVTSGTNLKTVCSVAVFLEWSCALVCSSSKVLALA